MRSRLRLSAFMRIFWMLASCSSVIQISTFDCAGSLCPTRKSASHYLAASSLLGIVPGLTIAIHSAWKSHRDWDLPFKACKTLSCIHTSPAADWKDDTTFPISTVQLWRLCRTIFGQLSPSTLRAIGRPNVSPAWTIRFGLRICIFAADVHDLIPETC